MRPAAIAEVRQAKESPSAFARRLAEEKARAVSRDPREVVLGADTIVTLGRTVLGKPSDLGDATRMLPRSPAGSIPFTLVYVFSLTGAQSSISLVLMLLLRTCRSRKYRITLGAGSHSTKPVRTECRVLRPNSYCP